MGVRPTRATSDDLAALLQRSRSDALTYAPTGGSLDGSTPPGLKRRHWTTELRGANAFDRAVEALRSWAVHRGAGLALAADGPIAVGTNVASARVSRPAHPIARLLPPLGDRLQDGGVRRYLSPMTRAITEDAPR